MRYALNCAHRDHSVSVVAHQGALIASRVAAQVVIRASGHAGLGGGVEVDV